MSVPKPSPRSPSDSAHLCRAPSDGSGDQVGEVRIGEVVVVGGPPGSGKTTVAAALAAEAALGVHLETDFFYRSIRAGFVAPHLPHANFQNNAVVDVATDAAGAYAEAGYRVYCDGVLGPWFIGRVAKRCCPPISPSAIVECRVWARNRGLLQCERGR